MPGTFTKADPIYAIQIENGCPLKKSNEIFESLLEIIRSTIESGEDVMISGFGEFQARAKRKRKGRNPATSEEMILTARKVAIF